jgi:23S rRNA (adenine2030-N6)-methyltransferase
MNYRHAFHAGNHTEILKHAVLALLLQHLRRKQAPFFVLDTHAGAGIYDLSSEEAKRTEEASEGIRRVSRAAIPLADSYLAALGRFNPNATIEVYPGSPAIVQTLLREKDRLVACELHSEDATRLKRHFRGDHRIAAHHRDGFEALRAFLPPPENRGLVFIDPPYEERAEFSRLARALTATSHRWPRGILVAWYPVKDTSAILNFERELRANAVPECLSVEVLVRPEDGVTLAGGGLILINPPWNFDNVLKDLAPQILSALGARSGSWRVTWLTPPE